MIAKQRGRRPEIVRVTFELPASIWADSIHIVGEFNDWDRSATPMTQAGPDGAWRATLELTANHEYQYRYLIDRETWFTDYNSDGFVTNQYGTDNSVVNTGLDVEPEAEPTEPASEPSQPPSAGPDEGTSRAA